MTQIYFYNFHLTFQKVGMLFTLYIYKINVMIIILSKVTSTVNSSDLHLPYIKVEVGRFSSNSKSTLQNVVVVF